MATLLRGFMPRFNVSVGIPHFTFPVMVQIFSQRVREGLKWRAVCDAASRIASSVLRHLVDTLKDARRSPVSAFRRWLRL